jgi:hypothetical protein
MFYACTNDNTQILQEKEVRELIKKLQSSVDRGFETVNIIMQEMAASLSYEFYSRKENSTFNKFFWVFFINTLHL